MNTFSELCVKFNCDKGLLPGGIGHGYCRHLEEILEPLRDKPVRLLELGVGDGKSIRVWLNYFRNPKAEIIGVDNWSECHQMDPDKRYHFIHGDQADTSFLYSLTSKQLWYDVVVDDGSHMSNGIIPSFEALWPFVKSGGLYIVEDLRCSYLDGYQVPNWPRQMAFIKQLLDDINAQTNYKPSPESNFTYPTGTDGGRGIAWLRFSEELCILRKK